MRIILASNSLSRLCLRHATSLQLKRYIGDGSKARKSNGAFKIAAALCTALGLSAGFIWYEIRELNKKLNSKKHQIDQWKPFTYDGYRDETTDMHTKRKKVKFPWLQLQLRSHDPQVLLRLAQCDDHSVRLLGIQALAKDHGWTDSQFEWLSNALDRRSVVGLARTPGVDHRIFLPPPKREDKGVALDEQLRTLISKLPLDNLEKCTKFFTQKAMQECPEAKKLEREFVWSIDGHGIYVEPSRTAFDRMLIYSLRALIDFSYLPSHCSKIVKEGGLVALQHVYEARKNSVKILRCIALILANLALQPSLHADIIDGGWVGILHEWMNTRDLELSLKAAKALANLDLDFGGQKKYAEGVYLYYPQNRFSEPIEADIVFVHGLLGGPFRTWRQKDSVLEAKAKAAQQLQQKQSPATSNDVEQNKNIHQNLRQKGDQHQDNSLQKRQTSVPSQEHQEQIAHRTRNISKDPVSNDKNNCAIVTSCNGNPDSNEYVDKTKGVQCDIQGEWEVKQIISLDTLFGKRENKKSTKKSGRYTFCWPKDWLSVDIPNARILSVGYETYLNEWEAECPYESEKRALSVRSYDMLDKLRLAGIGDRPIIWVGHSMGGLLIKQMLVTAETDPRYEHMLQQSKGILFYSVPHRGSQLADYARRIKHIYSPSVEVKELVTGCPKLLALHDRFKDLMFNTGIPLLSFAEGSETQLPLKFKLVIVPEKSCDPGFGEFHIMKDLTHLNICKPESDTSPVYTLTLQFIHDCVPLGRVSNVLRASLHSDNEECSPTS